MNTTHKPIVVIRFNTNGISENVSHINSELQEKLSEKWADYHVLVIPTADQYEDFHIQTFYEKDFTEIQFEELKKIVEGSIKTTIHELAV